MINVQVKSNIGEIVHWIGAFRPDKRKMQAWSRKVQRHEREQAQRAIKNRGRGDFRWRTPLYRTGFLYSRVNSSFRLRGLKENYVLSVRTPVFYASYLADRWPYLNMTEKDVDTHVNALAALIFDDRKTPTRGLLSAGR